MYEYCTSIILNNLGGSWDEDTRNESERNALGLFGVSMTVTMTDGRKRVVFYCINTLLLTFSQT